MRKIILLLILFASEGWCQSALRYKIIEKHIHKKTWMYQLSVDYPRISGLSERAVASAINHRIDSLITSWTGYYKECVANVWEYVKPDREAMRINHFDVGYAVESATNEMLSLWFGNIGLVALNAHSASESD